MTPIQAAHLSVASRLPISFEIFAKCAAGWEQIPVCVGGECVGAILANGPEIHACILPAGFNKWLTPKLHRAIFRDRLRRFGVLRTAALEQNQVGRQFIERLGFTLASIENNIANYEVRYGI